MKLKITVKCFYKTFCVGQTFKCNRVDKMLSLIHISTTVHITFGQPIYPDQLERAEKKHLGATIREEIIEMRKKHKTS